MSFFGGHKRISRVGAVALIGLALGATGFAGEAASSPGKAIRFSDPTHPGVGTNVNFGPSAAFEEFTRTERSISPGPSIGGSLRPVVPPRFAPMTRRDRELKDEKENWVFTTPEEFLNNFMLEEVFKVSTPGYKTELPSSIERFYERFGNSRSNTRSNAVDQVDFFGRDRDEEDADFDGVRTGARYLDFDENARRNKRESDGSRFLSASQGDDLRELLGFDPREFTPEADKAQRAQEDRIREFRNLLVPQPAAKPLAVSPLSAGQINIRSDNLYPSLPHNPFGAPMSSDGAADAFRPAGVRAPGLPGTPMFFGQSGSLAPVIPQPRSPRLATPQPHKFDPPQRPF